MCQMVQCRTLRRWRRHGRGGPSLCKLGISFLNVSFNQTVSILTTFFLLMTLYPEVQRRAQSEIDQLVASDRLPTFDDYDSLPYIIAMIKEVVRWGPVAPLGKRIFFIAIVLRPDACSQGYHIE